MEKLYLRLQMLAKRRCWDEADDFNPMDHSGGNFDDAYAGGQDDGYTHLAREILQTLEEIEKN